MNLNETKFQRRYRRLQTRNSIPLTTTHIPHFQTIIGFDIIHNGKYYMQLTHSSVGYCIFHLQYTHLAFDLLTNNIRDLPVEINRAISEYLPSYIILDMRMDYNEHYPFCPPIWSLMNYDDRLASSLKNSEEYYKYIISNHNQSNQISWTPAIDIDKDILALMIRINHFDSLFLD
uniref:Uncharacterized protein n=1 Tax=viral metagenome TaxID=1070528 RepID=A0A6C0HHM0_9ZZZZ